MTEPIPTPALPCPECKRRGIAGNCRIGNRRNGCGTCNAFAQNVLRISRQRLRELHPEEYDAIRLRVEIDLYPQVIERDAQKYPERTEEDL